MATVLNIVIVPTYDKYTMGVMDNSSYDIPVVSPTLTITMPGFEPVDVVFVENTLNILDSEILGLTVAGEDKAVLPDGVYAFTYAIDPAATYYIEKNIMRVDQLQEKFDEAFLTLDMMECDKAIKKQSKVDLSSIWFLIQGSIAAANNCATIEATKLYQSALKALTSFIKNNCGCYGNNYVVNF